MFFLYFRREGFVLIELVRIRHGLVVDLLKDVPEEASRGSAIEPGRLHGCPLLLRA